MLAYHFISKLYKLSFSHVDSCVENAKICYSNSNFKFIIVKVETGIAVAATPPYIC